jgi:hypothetical protein
MATTTQLLLKDLRLNEDDEDHLIALCEHAGWEVFMRVVRKLQRDLEERVLKYNLEVKGQDGLAYSLSEVRGAARLVDQVIAISKDARGQ